MNAPEPEELYEEIESLAEQANSLIHATGSLSSEDMRSFSQSLREHSERADTEARVEEATARRASGRLAWVFGIGVVVGVLLSRAMSPSSPDDTTD